jgi:type VI secretion system protein ImpG
MNEEFLRDYYETELNHIREVAAGFGEAHPRAAGQLRLDRDRCGDPFVERLLEGFAFLAARVRQKLDADFPVFTEGLLESVYPALLQPVPSMGIVEFTPEDGLTEPHVVERGGELTGHLGPDVDTRCEFRTAHQVTMHSFRISISEEGRPRYYDRDLDRLQIPHGVRVKGALRLRLELNNGAGTFREYADGPLAELERGHPGSGDELVLFLRGGNSATGRIYEALFAQCSHLITYDGGRTRPTASGIFELSRGSGVELQPGGVGREEALLPVDARTFEGYRLLREYLAIPERFLFIKLRGLRRILASVDSSVIDLVFGFRENVRIASVIKDDSFVLHATPVVNLFRKRSDLVPLPRTRSEFHLVADRTKPLHYEVISITKVTGLGKSARDKTVFQPFFRCDARDPGARAFYAVRRDQRRLTTEEMRRGPSSKYLGTELYLQLVDANHAPFSGSVELAAVEALCSNRHLPMSMPLKGSDTDLIQEGGIPVSAIRWLVPPTNPSESLATGPNAWRFISHLSLNYLSLVDEEGAGVAAFKDLLRIYLPESAGDTGQADWIEGIMSVSSQPVVKRLRGGGPVAYQRGLTARIVFDERYFSGSSAFLMGMVLSRFLSNHVTVNSFVETEIQSASRGHLVTWPPSPGRNALV